MLIFFPQCTNASAIFSSPLKVKEDDEVDNLDLKLDARKKSKRVYRSPPPEVSLKISRSLKVCRLLTCPLPI